MTERPQNTHLVKIILYTSGLTFLGAGAYGLLNPSFIQDLLQFDDLGAKIFSGALVFAGLADFLLARFVFKGKDRL